MKLPWWVGVLVVSAACSKDPAAPDASVPMSDAAIDAADAAPDALPDASLVGLGPVRVRLFDVQNVAVSGALVAFLYPDDRVVTMRYTDFGVADGMLPPGGSVHVRWIDYPGHFQIYSVLDVNPGDEITINDRHVEPRATYDVNVSVPTAAGANVYRIWTTCGTADDGDINAGVTVHVWNDCAVGDMFIAGFYQNNMTYTFLGGTLVKNQAFSMGNNIVVNTPMASNVSVSVGTTNTPPQSSAHLIDEIFTSGTTSMSGGSPPDSIDGTNPITVPVPNITTGTLKVIGRGATGNGNNLYWFENAAPFTGTGYVFDYSTWALRQPVSPQIQYSSSEDRLSWTEAGPGTVAPETVVVSAGRRLLVAPYTGTSVRIPRLPMEFGYGSHPAVDELRLLRRTGGYADVKRTFTLGIDGGNGTSAAMWWRNL